MSEKEPQLRKRQKQRVEDIFYGENRHENQRSQEVDLKEKILHLQLEYVQKLLTNRGNRNFSPSENIDIASMDFYQAINIFTDLARKIGDAYDQWKGEPFWDSHNYPEFENKYKEIVSSIEEIYKNHPEGWIQKVDVLIFNALPKRKNYSSQSKKAKEAHAGVLRYDIGAGGGGKEAVGIIRGDMCIKTHLDPLLMKQGVSDGKSLSKLYEESYAILAKEIAKKYPDVRQKIKAVISESWLFDTNLTKKIGIIHTYPSSNDDTFHGDTFWGQFVNKNGQINEKRANQLLETGKPPFKVKSMYIPINEFMDKYGPRE